LAKRKELSYGHSYRDWFPVNVNKFISVDKLTTKSLRLTLSNRGANLEPINEFSSIKMVIHPKEREILYFELHNALLTNLKLYEMKLVSSPNCELCNCEQTTEHIFITCSNAKISTNSYDELKHLFEGNHLLTLNVQANIKRLLYLNKNKQLNSDLFKIAITNRINDFKLINDRKTRKKNLIEINKLSLMS
jgi:hypothetical protein